VDLTISLVVFGALLAVALLSADRRLSPVFTMVKPFVTLSLLLVTGLPRGNRFTLLMVLGLLFSAIGDAALLNDTRGFFLAGVGFFLIAHLAYTAAFVWGGGAAPLSTASPWLGVAVMTAATLWLMRRIWAGVTPGLKVAAGVYAVAVTVTAAAAFWVLAGPWPEPIGLAVTAGALLFYCGDSILAWDKFHGRLRHGQTLNLAFYWVGQLGLALAARWVGSGWR
jgi:uncharacterized membrane protein YhhN